MVIKLNKAKVNHLLGLINDNETEGFYYGNKKHYQKRHEELKEELNKLIENN